MFRDPVVSSSLFRNIAPKLSTVFFSKEEDNSLTSAVYKTLPINTNAYTSSAYAAPKESLFIDSKWTNPPLFIQSTTSATPKIVRNILDQTDINIPISKKDFDELKDSKVLPSLSYNQTIKKFEKRKLTPNMTIKEFMEDSDYITLYPPDGDIHTRINPLFSSSIRMWKMLVECNPSDNDLSHVFVLFITEQNDGSWQVFSTGFGCDRIPIYPEGVPRYVTRKDKGIIAEQYKYRQAIVTDNEFIQFFNPESQVRVISFDEVSDQEKFKLEQRLNFVAGSITSVVYGTGMRSYKLDTNVFLYRRTREESLNNNDWYLPQIIQDCTQYAANMGFPAVVTNNRIYKTGFSASDSETPSDHSLPVLQSLKK